MENRNDKNTKRLALAGQLCGATLLLTLISIPLPSGYGYVNLGDGGVFLCAMLLPGGLGAMAAGVGAALADLILGWAVYAPATLLRQRARELGMRTLREDGMLKVASGMTSLQEVLRVTMGDAD